MSCESVASFKVSFRGKTLYKAWQKDSLANIPNYLEGKRETCCEDKKSKALYPLYPSLMCFTFVKKVIELPALKKITSKIKSLESRELSFSNLV